MIINSFVPSEEIFNTGFDGMKVVNKHNEGELFSNVLKESLDKINEKQIVADKSTESFVKGEDIDISEVMLAGAEASVSLQFAVQVRNKLVEAYQEISRMQL
ncbi:MAG: flagellar hook-basal body complex protein FliE [Clostridium sp.]|uniref:Flagellar hook-basal body complex protein FliE n=1 Tax=Clostridium paraputrificum TaxID=29363 RepID=A0A6N3GVI4_9CLOT|nr:flagellar hook-basal body complex protein FliE [Clostridium sp.]MBS5925657.1 flagellar hook-basal body complex protein FliE [Clostridium sp.]